MRPPLFCSSSSQQNSDCQPQLLPTIVRLAPTTHPGERSLPIGDELAESPLVSKSRIAQIVPVSRSLDDASAVAGSHDSRCSPTYRMVDHTCADHIQVNIHQTAMQVLIA